METGSGSETETETETEVAPEKNQAKEDVVAHKSSSVEDGYQPSQQWIIWAIMFGILLLAVLLTF